MKCNYCNAPITLEDEYCPYCGARNEGAQQHVEDMKKFNRDYERTKEDVMGNVTRQSRSHARLIAILLMVVLNVIVIAAQFGSYEIEELLDQWKVNSHKAEYSAQLDEYETNGEYVQLYYYYMRNSLYNGLREYDSVYSCCGDYRRFEEGIYYLTHPDVNTYSSQSYYVEEVSQAVAGLYETMSYKDNEWSAEEFTEKHLAAMEDIQARMKAELKAYCKLTDDDLVSLEETDRQSLMVLIGRRMGIYE